MDINSKILVTGSRGVLGTAVRMELEAAGFKNCLFPDRRELDCANYSSVQNWFQNNEPEYVFHLASLVYGLKGNLDNKINALRDNIVIADGVLNACGLFQVKKVFYAGTVAAYPYPYESLPLREDCFWFGKPHQGEYGYAIAKRYALSLLELIRDVHGVDFSYGIFTNLYGPNDRFNADSGHVIPSLIRKSVESSKNNRSLVVWGRPDTTRDFLYSRDAARAAIHCMGVDLDMVNISSGVATTMGDVVAEIISSVDGKLMVSWDVDAPIGIPNRVVSNDRLVRSGFKIETTFHQGIVETVRWYMNHEDLVRI